MAAMRDRMTHQKTPQRSRYRPLLQLDRVSPDPAEAVTFRFTTDDGWPVVVEAHAPGVFRVTIAAPGVPASDRVSDLADLLARSEAIGEAQLEDQAGVWRVVQGDDTLEIHTNPLRFVVQRQGSPLLASAAGLSLGPLTEGAGWLLSFGLTDDEPVHGLGESTVSLNRRGETLVSDVPADRVVPLAWSPRGWGVHVNTVGRVVHHVGAGEPNEYLLDVQDARLDLFLFAGDPADILNQYTQITGRAGQPPLWSLGVWVRQPPGANADDTLALAARLRQEGIAFDALALDTPAAWEVRNKQALEWDAARFPDAKPWLAEFKKHDVRVCAPGFPGVTRNSPMFDELEDRGWLLTGDDGGACMLPGCEATAGQPYALLDFTHRDVFTFWLERHRQLLDDGLDAVSCDAQIDIPDEVTARNGASGARLRTLYPMLAARSQFEASAWNKVPPEGLVWHRDLFPAAQRLPFNAGPGVSNDWNGLAATLRAALSSGASGVTAQSHEIGSQLADPAAMTPELYLRWLALGVFSAHFRLQGMPALLPSAFDEAVQAEVRTWLQWRYRLVPYILGAIEDAGRNGLPVQRSMALAFPRDAKAQAYEFQYLLGPALLVAPAMQPGNEVQVYLPEGEAWWDLNTGWRYEGGTTWTFPCGEGRLPVFGREGHILCLGPGGQHTGEFNSARLLDEVWLFGMPVASPTVMRNKIRVMQMQGSSYIKGLEGLRILPSEGLEVKRRGAEVRISRAR